MTKVTIKTPATSANLGLGFDSMGIALERFLTLNAEVNPSEKWEFSYLKPELEVLAEDESNIVAQTAIKTAQIHGAKMPALKVEMDSEIPLSHGQGSSSSAIVGGIELANHFCELELSEYEKLKLACQIEGHPDNVGPCITGGAFVGYYSDAELYYYTFQLKGVSLILTEPPYEISTEEVRKVLPDSYSRSDAVGQNALNNIMLMAMERGDFETMGEVMMQDKFHEPYRSPFIKEFNEVKKLALEKGAYATVISGAGPTILTLCPEDKCTEIVEALEKALPNCNHLSVDIYYK